MSQPRLMPLMERFVRAMIAGANRAGFDTEMVYRSLEVPIHYPDKLFESPPSEAALDDYRRDVESARLSVTPPNLDEPLDVSSSLFLKMQRNIKWLLRDEFYCLTPNRCTMGTYLFMIEMIMKYETLEEALVTATRFYRIATNDVRLTLTRSGQYAELRIDLEAPELDDLGFMVEWQLTLWHRFSCWLIGESIPITHAEFRHPMLSPAEDYERMFCKQCSFDQPHSLIRFYAPYLDKFNVRLSTDFSEFISARFELAYIPGNEGAMATRIEAKMEHRFRDTLDFLSMEEVAEAHHVSTQTLRRRLEGEGTSFREIKDNIRRKVAMKWLRDPSIPLSEVARLSGFADPNGLSRAVKGWTNMNPSEFRQQECGGSSTA